jgi:hypothetical protein
MDNGGIGLTVEFLLSPFALVLLVAFAILLIVPLAIGAGIGIARRLRREPGSVAPSPDVDALNELFGRAQGATDPARP